MIRRDFTVVDRLSFIYAVGDQRCQGVAVASQNRSLAFRAIASHEWRNRLALFRGAEGASFVLNRRPTNRNASRLV